MRGHPLVRVRHYPLASDKGSSHSGFRVPFQTSKEFRSQQFKPPNDIAASALTNGPISLPVVAMLVRKVEGRQLMVLRS